MSGLDTVLYTGEHRHCEHSLISDQYIIMYLRPSPGRDTCRTSTNWGVAQHNNNNKSGGQQAHCKAATGNTYRQWHWHWEQHLGIATTAATIHKACLDQLHPTSTPKNPDIPAAPALRVCAAPRAMYRWEMPKYPCHWTEHMSLRVEKWWWDILFLLLNPPWLPQDLLLCAAHTGWLAIDIWLSGSQSHHLS